MTQLKLAPQLRTWSIWCECCKPNLCRVPLDPALHEIDTDSRWIKAADRKQK